MANLKELDRSFNAHEQVCAERWRETIHRIKRLETILIGTAGSSILLLLGVLIK